MKPFKVYICVWVRKRGNKFPWHMAVIELSSDGSISALKNDKTRLKLESISSRIEARLQIVDGEIVVRDRNRFDCFKDGSCTRSDSGSGFPQWTLLCDLHHLRNIEMSSRPKSYLSYARSFQLKANLHSYLAIEKKSSSASNKNDLFTYKRNKLHLCIDLSPY